MTRTGSPSTLDNETVVDLVRSAQAGDETATETVARSFRHLVRRVVGEFKSSSGTGPDPAAGRLGQLVDWGEAGLRTAIAKFDASMGIRFSTYAVEQIRRAIADGPSGASGPGTGGESGGGGAGDRYPRRPRPSSGAGSAAQPLSR